MSTITPDTGGQSVNCHRGNSMQYKTLSPAATQSLLLVRAPCRGGGFLTFPRSEDCLTRCPGQPDPATRGSRRFRSRRTGVIILDNPQSGQRRTGLQRSLRPSRMTSRSDRSVTELLLRRRLLVDKESTSQEVLTDKVCRSDGIVVQFTYCISQPISQCR